MTVFTLFLFTQSLHWGSFTQDFGNNLSKQSVYKTYVFFQSNQKKYIQSLYTL
jgi:hypothetical protein